MTMEPRRAAMTAFMFGISILFIIIALTRFVGGEMFLIFGIAILLFAITSLTVWGIRQFRHNRKV